MELYKKHLLFCQSERSEESVCQSISLDFSRSFEMNKTIKLPALWAKKLKKIKIL